MWLGHLVLRPSVPLTNVHLEIVNVIVDHTIEEGSTNSQARVNCTNHEGEEQEDTKSKPPVDTSMNDTSRVAIDSFVTIEIW